MTGNLQAAADVRELRDRALMRGDVEQAELLRAVAVVIEDGEERAAAALLRSSGHTNHRYVEHCRQCCECDHCRGAQS